MNDIREMRQQTGLTQTQLARLAGIAPSNLSSIESGRRRASDGMRARLRHAMRRPSTVLEEHRDEVRRLIYECGAENPRVFGSAAFGNDTPTSDLDILVTVRPANAWKFVSLKTRLTKLLGIDVDIVTDGGLRDKHKHILAEAVPL